MTSKRLYLILLALVGLLVIGLFGGAYGASKLLASQSAKLVDNRLQTKVLDEEQNQLSQAKQDIRKYQELATVAKSVVPQDKDQAQTVREIVKIAQANSVALSSIAFPTSTLGAAKGTLSQLTPVKSISGVYNLQLTVQSDSNKPVAYSNFIGFLAALEHNRRTALVNSITIQPNIQNRNNLSFTLILDEYIKP